MMGVRGIRVRFFVFIASAKIPEREQSISHVFCLVYQVDEFPFKEMRDVGSVQDFILFYLCLT